MKLAVALAVFLAALGYLGFKLLGPFGRSRPRSGSAVVRRLRGRAPGGTPGGVPAQRGGRD